MDLSLPKIKHPTLNYWISRVPLDNEEIFNRGTTIEERNMHKKWNPYDYNVYIFIDKRYKADITLPFGIKIYNKIVYIGKGIYNDKNPIKSRACMHHDDLLSKMLLDGPSNYECIMFGDGMTENEARCLEALWIYSLVEFDNYKLSKPSQIKDLINKRRELKWEKRAHIFLNENNFKLGLWR